VAESVLPLALVGAVSLAPVLGSDPIISRGGQLIFATLAGLTGVAALARQRRTTRLGLAFTATIAAFAMPWEVCRGGRCRDWSEWASTWLPASCPCCAPDT
jgi:hypothetical protein